MQTVHASESSALTAVGALKSSADRRDKVCFAVDRPWCLLNQLYEWVCGWFVSACSRDSSTVCCVVHVVQAEIQSDIQKASFWIPESTPLARPSKTPAVSCSLRLGDLPVTLRAFSYVVLVSCSRTQPLATPLVARSFEQSSSSRCTSPVCLLTTSPQKGRTLRQLATQRTLELQRSTVASCVRVACVPSSIKLRLSHVPAAT
jgi:hypothetical protein